MGNTSSLNLALLIVIFHFAIPASSMKSTTLLTDQSALLALKHHIIHDPQNVLTSNWSASTPVCNWFGVRCGSKHRRVTALDLSGLGLVGTLPPHLGNLSFLSFFVITNNSFHGRLPAQLSNLQRLKILGLGNNSFSGEIPPWLGSLTQLTKLYLYENNFKGVIPFSLGNLSKLQELSLFENQVSGEIPEQITNLTLLRVLECLNNNLTGTLPRNIGNLKKLEFLDLGGNNISGSIPPELFNISTLSLIYLASNQLSGHLPPTMGLWLPNLEELNLGDNQLVGSIPMSISNASQLSILSVYVNYFSGSIPDTLGNLKYLERLKIFDNNLTSPGMSFLASLTNCRALEHLSFGQNPFISGTLPNSVGNLSASLQTFYAYGCNIDGSIPGEIGNLTRLIVIALQDNKLTGKIPTTIRGLTELQSLSLLNNNIEGSIPSEVCHLNSLYQLLLTSNKLSGPIPACLGNLISLRELYLASNMFSSSLPSTLTGLNYLLILDLSSNSLTGPLPIDIGNWKVLTTLDLSNNQFSSDIPTGIAQLKDLTQFSLSNNRITGPILESFGDLMNLEFLDLSRNNLSGEIPKSLEKLRHLNYFNVSFNRLQGEIPKGGLFGNYSMESFEGNEALCGAPRLHLPSCKTSPVIRNSKARTKLIIFLALPITSTILLVALIIIILKKRKKKDKLATLGDLLPLGTWRRISYHELHQGTDGFSESRLLGNGSYGSVYKGILSDGMEIAVKVFKLELEGAFKSFDVECEVLRNTRHRNLIKIISSCSNDLDYKALVLEFMPNGNLDTWLHSDNHCLDMLQRLNIMIDVASALEYLHHGNASPVVHCDLKPNNVLLDEGMVAHVSDFGIAKLLCKEDSMIQTMTMATIGYMAPEYGVEGMVSTKGDVYSFGILMMEVITRKKPTDEMFGEERSLKRWVEESVSSPLNQVVDSNLLSSIGGKERLAANNCALSILRVGIECAAELPDERLDMKEVVTKLKKIKVKFLKDIQRVR